LGAFTISKESKLAELPIYIPAGVSTPLELEAGHTRLISVGVPKCNEVILGFSGRITSTVVPVVSTVRRFELLDKSISSVRLLQFFIQKFYNLVILDKSIL